MSSVWLVLPLTADVVTSLQDEGLRVCPPTCQSANPTPAQVFDVVESLGYSAEVWKRGQNTIIQLRDKEGVFAVEVNLLGVGSNSEPVQTLAFADCRAVDELVQLIRPLAERCGPLVLYNDLGAPSVLVQPTTAAKPCATDDSDPRAKLGQ